jgi:hypothetical protein
MSQSAAFGFASLSGLCGPIEMLDAGRRAVTSDATAQFDCLQRLQPVECCHSSRRLGTRKWRQNRSLSRGTIAVRFWRDLLVLADEPNGSVAA